MSRAGHNGNGVEERFPSDEEGTARDGRRGKGKKKSPNYTIINQALNILAFGGVAQPSHKNKGGFVSFRLV